jgi:hypothetical protein
VARHVRARPSADPRRQGRELSQTTPEWLPGDAGVLPVTECLDDPVGRPGPERPLFPAPSARCDHGRILLDDNQLRVSVQQPAGLARRIFERAGDRLSMVTPCHRQLLLSAESEQTGERRGVLGVDCLAPPKGAAHERRRPGHQVFDGQYAERTGLVVQCRRARERFPERPKEVHSNRGRFVNQLQQGLAFSRIRVDMVQEKGRRDRLGNRSEPVYDQIDVVQVLPFDRTTMRAELRSDRQPARQRASKAMGQDCSHRSSRSTRIVLVQQGREHA